jgi:hypothetical protein
MIRTASDEWLKKLDEKAFKWKNRAARTRFGADVAGFQTELVATLEGWVMGAEVRMRLDESGLIGVLESQRFQVLAETGSSSSGVSKSDVRAEDELNIFGIELDAPPEERPTYGYLEGSDEAGDVSGYGTIVIGLHDCVRESGTFVLGDTRDSNIFGAVFAPVPLLAPSIAAFSNMRDGLLNARTLADACHGDYRYAEVQIHGGLSSRAIARVVYTRGTKPSPRAGQLLAEHQIEPELVVGDDPGPRSGAVG